jgi:hypothetical protein
MPITSAQEATKLLKLQLYKTIVVHAFKKHDPAARINFLTGFFSLYRMEKLNQN